MYDEKTFKNYIFWLKVKRIVFLLLFSAIGALIGIVLSDLLINVLTFSNINKPVIIALSTVVFFSLSLLATTGTEKNIQDGYLKIAVLRKLTVISKKLDNLPNLEEQSSENRYSFLKEKTKSTADTSDSE